MGHRDMSNPFMISKLHGQHANNYPPVEQPYIPRMDNGHFVVPMDYGSNPHRNFGGGYNEQHPSFVSMEVQQVPVPPFSGPPVDPYIYSSTSGNTFVAPLGPVGHFHPSHFYDPCMGHIPGGYNEHNPSFVSTEVQQVSGPPVDPYTHSSTVGHFHPSHFYDPGMGHIPAGRYKEHHPSFVSMEVQQVPVPPVDPYTHSSIVGHFHPSHYYDPGMGHIPAAGHGGPFKRKKTSILTDHQTWTRNVRSRSIPEFEPCMIRTHVPSYGSHFHQPTNSHVPVHPINPNADVMSQGWNASTEDAYNYNSGSITLNGSNPSDQFSYMNDSSSSTSELHIPSEPTSPGYSSHSEGGWDHGYRNGRPSMAVPRPSPIVDVIGAHERLEHETLTTDQNSMNFPDQFQEMRLNIADMSYEELLALEERIGNVSTGLSEEGMFECLSEQVYCSIDRIHEEASCPICLEDFKNGE
ncbi:zinc finger, RING/FYVE/PHD-type [Artemisia annua]|uniref:RING-type E3 ubiquitin transferase n=1 Tax=Artemisia annua TaxID=35608 RepID=A0A2U1L7K5_ARTAN|nr:zinc finger, RING/FYVE/PHD-type [Artemisia annua]